MMTLTFLASIDWIAQKAGRRIEESKKYDLVLGITVSGPELIVRIRRIKLCDLLGMAKTIE